MRSGICTLLTGVMLLGLAHAAPHEDNWPMYGRNLQHTFSNPHSRINPRTVKTLQKRWFFATADAVTASPTVVDGVVYVGSWDGFFYALDADTGGLRWKFQVDCQNSVIPIPPQCLGPGQTPPPRFSTDGGLITSSAAVIEGKVYFASGKTLYSLNARDGTLRWKHVVCGNPEEVNCAFDPNDPTRIFSSPAIFEHAIFVGWTVDGAVGYRGAIGAFDLQTGRSLWRFEVDPTLGANGDPVIIDGHVAGGQNRGCGNVWSSAAIDTDHHLVFFGTGDCQDDATPPYHQAILALHTRTGQLRWVYRPRASDPFKCDFDFGTSANIIDTAEGHFVGLGGKDGTYYLLDRLTSKASGQLVWSRNVVFGGIAGGFFGAAAFEGTQLFSATGLGDGDIATQSGLCDPADTRDTFIEEPSLHALDLGSGGILWQQSMNLSFAPTTLADEVVLSGTLGALSPPALNAYDARSGKLLASFPMPGAVNSGATPVGDTVFVGSGNSNDGAGGGVHALSLASDARLPSM
jgi:polyvinyl alcohol dehydrogenase (cytochrome)